VCITEFSNYAKHAGITTIRAPSQFEVSLLSDSVCTCATVDTTKHRKMEAVIALRLMETEYPHLHNPRSTTTRTLAILERHHHVSIIQVWLRGR
jgi:hypothetical protein